MLHKSPIKLLIILGLLGLLLFVVGTSTADASYNTFVCQHSSCMVMDANLNQTFVSYGTVFSGGCRDTYCTNAWVWDWKRKRVAYIYKVNGWVQLR